MTLEKIMLLAQSGESEVLEFKTSTGTRQEATKTICGMLNHRGGHVLFGLSPDGRLVGQQVSERTIEELSAELQRIDPPVFPSIERVSVDDKSDLVVVHVKRGNIAPYRYKGNAYRRVGSTTKVMSSEESNRVLFERMHVERRWENQSAEGWSIDDLDLDEVRNTVSVAMGMGRLRPPFSTEPHDLLTSLGLIENGELLKAAAVLFGKEERLQPALPQCSLQVARFRGKDRSTFLDNRRFCGNAFTLFDLSQRFLRETLPIASRFEPGNAIRIDEPRYPPIATREALANAFIHREYAIAGGSIAVAVYDDRLEITSPGTLHFGLTADQLLAHHASLCWNPLIAKVFYLRGVIEQWGRGIDLMMGSVEEAGLPALQIEAFTNWVSVTFRHSDEKVSERVAGTLNDCQYELLTLLQKNENGLALREILSFTSQETSKRRLRQDLSLLSNKGLVQVTGSGWAARWRAT